MKILNITVYIFVATFLFSSTYDVSALEENRRTPADFLVEVGKTDLQKGNIQQAIHEFSKALMMDPHHKEAKQLLVQFGIEDGLYTKQKTHLSRISDMGDHIRSYRAKLEDLERQKADLKNQFARLQVEHFSIIRENKNKDLEISKLKTTITAIQKTANHNKGIYEGKVGQMDQANEYHRESLLDMQEAMNQEKEAALAPLANHRKLKQNYEAYHDKFDKSIEYSAYLEEELLSLSDKYHSLNSQISDQYVHQDKLIHVLEDYLKLREASLDDALDEALYKHVDLTQADSMVLAKLNELIDLHDDVDQKRNRIDDLHDDLMISKDMILDRNKEINDLQEEIQGADHYIQILLDEQREKREMLE